MSSTDDSQPNPAQQQESPVSDSDQAQATRRADPAAFEPDVQKPGDQRLGVRVLVADDNRSATVMLSRLLTKLGAHAVTVAHDGASAVDIAQSERPDLIVLDVGLPELTGHQVADQLRRCPQLQRTLIVALTGYGAEEDRRASLESGFDLHLVKPIGMDELRNLLAHPKLGRG